MRECKLEASSLLPKTKAHILSVTFTTGLFSESGRLKDPVELALGLAFPVAETRPAADPVVSLSGSFAADAAPTPSQLHIAQAHGLS